MNGDASELILFTQEVVHYESISRSAILKALEWRHVRAKSGNHDMISATTGVETTRQIAPRTTFDCLYHWAPQSKRRGRHHGPTMTNRSPKRQPACGSSSRSRSYVWVSSSLPRSLPGFFEG